MKHLQVLCLGAATLFIQAEAPSDKEKQCWKLNNEGTALLAKKDFRHALEKFEAALQVDPNCHLSEKNSAIAHGQFGIQLNKENKLTESLREFCWAAYSDHYWDDDVSKAIQLLGKDPLNFADRVTLAEEEISTNNYRGAAVEYRAALKLKPDHQIERKLAALQRQIEADNEVTNRFNPPLLKNFEHKGLLPINDAETNF